MAFAKLAGKFEDLLSLIEELIQVAESEFTQPGSGAEKREFVISRINEDVNIPILFSEDREAELIGVLVDHIVELYNRGRLFATSLAEEAVDQIIDSASKALKDLF